MPIFSRVVGLLFSFIYFYSAIGVELFNQNNDTYNKFYTKYVCDL
jgi:hypothetical protein